MATIKRKEKSPEQKKEYQNLYKIRSNSVSKIYSNPTANPNSNPNSITYPNPNLCKPFARPALFQLCDVSKNQVLLVFYSIPTTSSHENECHTMVAIHMKSYIVARYDRVFLCTLQVLNNVQLKWIQSKIPSQLVRFQVAVATSTALPQTRIFDTIMEVDYWIVAVKEQRKAVVGNSLCPHYRYLSQIGSNYDVRITYYRNDMYVRLQHLTLL